MIKFVLRLVVYAFIIQFVLPIVPGVTFVGHFWPDAILYSFLFGLVAVAVDILLALAALVFVGATAGLGLVLLPLLAIIAMIVVPGVQLEALATWFPHHFAIDTFGHAVLAGLLLVFCNVVIAGISRAFKGEKASS